MLGTRPGGRLVKLRDLHLGLLHLGHQDLHLLAVLLLVLLEAVVEARLLHLEVGVDVLQLLRLLPQLLPDKLQLLVPVGQLLPVLLDQALLLLQLGLWE